MPATLQSGSLIVNRIICAIWNRDVGEDDRIKAVDQFKAFKGGDFVALSPSVASTLCSVHSPIPSNSQIPVLHEVNNIVINHPTALPSTSETRRPRIRQRG